MTRHEPPQCLVALLLTCDLCKGEGTYATEQHAINACQCQNGRIAVALPLMDVIHAGTLPSDTARHAYLLKCAKEQGPTPHPMLFSTANCPTYLTTPLKNNPSDITRRIPLTPTK